MRHDEDGTTLTPTERIAHKKQLRYRAFMLAILPIAVIQVAMLAWLEGKSFKTVWGWMWNAE